MIWKQVTKQVIKLLMMAGIWILGSLITLIMISESHNEDMNIVFAILFTVICGYLCIKIARHKKMEIINEFNLYNINNNNDYMDYENQKSPLTKCLLIMFTWIVGGSMIYFGFMPIFLSSLLILAANKTLMWSIISLDLNTKLIFQLMAPYAMLSIGVIFICVYITLTIIRDKK